MELQMKKMQQLVEENERLNSLIQQLTGNLGMSGAIAPAAVTRTFGQGIRAVRSFPRKHIDELCEVQQVSTEMVECWKLSQ